MTSNRNIQFTGSGNRRTSFRRFRRPRSKAGTWNTRSTERAPIRAILSVRELIEMGVPIHAIRDELDFRENNSNRGGRIPNPKTVARGYAVLRRGARRLAR